MAVHPGGEGLICSLPKSCRWFEWDFQRAENRSLGLISSERVLEPLQDVGQQLALTFNHEVLYLPLADGKLRVYKWPSMENILDQDNSHASVKDLDFRWKISCICWKWPLPDLGCLKIKICCFFDEGKYQGGSISKWSTTSWKRIKSKRIVRDPICAFNVSPNRKLLAVGTIEGDVLIVSSNNFQVQNVVKKAHLGLVTTLKFSEDSRALLSASMDSRVRVTIIKDEEKKSGLSLWIVILVLLIAIAVYYAASKRILPLELNSILK